MSSKSCKQIYRENGLDFSNYKLVLLNSTLIYVLCVLLLKY